MQFRMNVSENLSQIAPFFVNCAISVTLLWTYFCSLQQPDISRLHLVPYPKLHGMSSELDVTQSWVIA